MRITTMVFCAMTAGAGFAAQKPYLAPPPPGFGPQAPVPAPKPAEEGKKPVKEKAKTTAPAAKSERGANEQAKTQTADRTAARPAQPALKQGAYGPGKDIGHGYRACVPGDTIPAGSVRDGYRKVSATTAFGPTCRWEKADGAPDGPPPAAVASAGPLPGIDVGGGYRGCAPTDNAAPGTEKNGYRKVIAVTPFGKSCRWDPIASAAPAQMDFRPCDPKDASPAGTVRDGFKKVEATTMAGKTCRWESISTAQ